MLCIRFEPARIIKRMTGSNERTCWRQDGELILEGVPGGLDEVPGCRGLPEGPCTCTGGTLDDNLYSYRDMIPVPWVSRGRIRCELLLEGRTLPLIVDAASVRLVMEGVPRYIEHLRP